MAELEEKDWDILRELVKDGRASYRKLAKKLGMHPATLIKRIERMEKEGMVRGYSANVDLFNLGYEFIAIIEIIISKGALLEVQEKIRTMPGILGIYDVTGEYDSIVIAACKNRQSLSALVKKILAIKDVERTNTHIILNIIKDRYEFVP